MIWALLALAWPLSPCAAAEPVTVVVEGIEGDPLKNVTQAVTLPPGLVHDGSVDRLWLERFARQSEEKVRTALEPFGYYNARIGTRLETVAPGVYRLLVTIEPGEPVRVTAVQVTVQGAGRQEEQLQEQVRAFPLQEGDILLQPAYDHARDNLRARARELGYLDAEFSRHEIRVDPEAASARIELVLETGEQYRFDGVTISGAPDYPEPFLRRYLSFKTGETFSYAKLGETQLNFTNSERFKEVVIVPDKQQAEELKVPVRVQLKPAPRRSLRPGIGYGTDTGARFSIRYRDLNLFHLGHELNMQLYIAERLQGLASGYIMPDTRDMKSATSLQLNLQREEITTYFSRLGALELARHRSFGTGQLGTVYLRLQHEEFTIADQTSISRLVLPGLRFVENRYENLIRPTHGYRYGLEVRGTSHVFGSDTGFLQVIAEGSHLQPLPWRFSLYTRVNTGLTMLSGLSELPPSVRFFAGGDQSVRGYDYKSLGPRDANGNVVGGKNLMTGSIELERALFAKWGLSLFYDAGNAFNTFDEFKVFQGMGIGLHYYTPVGGLNLAVARQIGVEHPGYHIHFTVGFEL
ncbi:autotransporter assembly complex family protein [Geobacter sp. SVR]|uniref:autotransporter assembly complex protein TamA n=1 Tax=Geobacter sp. SVR TaxID=2495594 RepID=UPI00143F0385|nr:autotransporter assembly complex family protein [Geobacter sp. SVR]GCF86362.1 outer membrane protein assembly factor [Geobacter sp. SVR]